MKLCNNILGYQLILLENDNDCKEVLDKLPENIGLFGFDTETNTKIDMSKRDNDNIDIMHDMPFLLQFGFNNTIYLIDFRTYDGDKNNVFTLFDSIVNRSILSVAQNIGFDINMLWNIGYEWHSKTCCDLMSISRLSLESKSEREGGLPIRLKPLARALLGSAYAEAGREIDEALKLIWHKKLKELELKLKPYGINRRTINEVLKNVTGTLDEFSEEVQAIWSSWNVSARISYADVDTSILYKYGGVDVILVLELSKLLLPIVKEKNQLEVLKREQSLVMPLVRMERTGYTIDKKYLIKCKQAIMFECNQIRDLNRSIIGKDIGASQHIEIKKAIFDKFGYTLTSTDKNMLNILIQTDTSMPEEVKNYIENVLYLRSLEKWISTYINPMLYKLNTTGDSKVYTQYNANGAVSGRFTSNFQQFPKYAIVSRVGDYELFHPRKMFTVSDGYPELAYIDYSQVELRVQAEYTYYATGGFGDINMLRAYKPFKCHKVDDEWRHDEDNELWNPVDLHTQSTHEAFPEIDISSPEFKKLRNIGKRVNFALIYGASLKRVKETLADCDPEVVSKLYYGFHNKFKDVKTYNNWVSKTWLRNGGYVTNLLGRRYYIKDMANVYKLNNYLIQGSAADIIKLVIKRVDSYLLKNNLKTRLQGCIHDELCICVAEGEHDVLYKIKEIMETTVKTYVPLVAEISVSKTTWAEKKGE